MTGRDHLVDDRPRVIRPRVKRAGLPANSPEKRRVNCSAGTKRNPAESSPAELSLLEQCMREVNRLYGILTIVRKVRGLVFQTLTELPKAEKFKIFISPPYHA